MRTILVAFLLIGVVHAGFSRAPMDWASVHTNDIVRWKNENKAPAGVAVDVAARTVRFLVEATGVKADETIEFVAIGPLSDRAYESLFVTVASPAALAEAFEQVGIPRGVAVDPFQARLWPQGEKVSLAIRPVKGKGEGSAWTNLASCVRDVRAATEGAVLERPVACTGGAREATGALVAATNVPCAVFALYNHGPSILQLDGQYDQTSTYGRFVSARNLSAGELWEMSASWDGVRRVKDVTLTLSATNAATVLSDLKTTSRDHELHVRLAFDSSVTISRAAALADAFALLDGPDVRLNGQAPGQFYFRAFLPDATWRARQGRIFQPFEVHVSPEGRKTFVFCEEDWSGDGMDPVLREQATPFADWRELPGLIARTGEQGAKVNVMFLFAPKTTPVTALTPVLAATTGRIGTFYVFDE